MSNVGPMSQKRGFKCVLGALLNPFPGCVCARMSHVCMVRVHALACVRSHVCARMCTGALAYACVRSHVHALAGACAHVRSRVRVRGCMHAGAGACACVRVGAGARTHT